MDELAKELLQLPPEQSASGAAVPAGVRHAPTDAISLCTPLLERFERWVSQMAHARTERMWFSGGAGLPS